MQSWRGREHRLDRVNQYRPSCCNFASLYVLGRVIGLRWWWCFCQHFCLSWLCSLLSIYLCDTDVTMVIPVECIQGITFVFYINDPILDAIQGMVNTYQVTSQFASDQMMIHHRNFFLCLFHLSLILLYPPAFLRACLGNCYQLSRSFNSAWAQGHWTIPLVNVAMWTTSIYSPCFLLLNICFLIFPL